MKLTIVKDIATGKIVSASRNKGLAVAKAAKSAADDLVIETTENCQIVERHYWLRRNRRPGEVALVDRLAKEAAAVAGDDVAAKAKYLHKTYPGYEFVALI